MSADAIALNGRIDAARPAPAVAGATAATAPVTVKTLQGGEATLALPTAVKSSDRQRAQLANERGLQLYKEKRYADAAEQFAEALKLRPDFALAANNLGCVYYRQECFAEAARLENTLKIDPSRAAAYLNLGDAYAKAGDPDKARKA